LDNLETLWDLQQRVENLEETVKELTAIESESEQDDEGDIFDRLEKDLFGAVIEG